MVTLPLGRRSLVRWPSSGHSQGLRPLLSPPGGRGSGLGRHRGWRLRGGRPRAVGRRERRDDAGRAAGGRRDRRRRMILDAAGRAGRFARAVQEDVARRAVGRDEALLVEDLAVAQDRADDRRLEAVLGVLDHDLGAGWERRVGLVDVARIRLDDLVDLGIGDLHLPVRLAAPELDRDVLSVRLGHKQDGRLGVVPPAQVDGVEQLVVLVVDLVDRRVQPLQATRRGAVPWDPVQVPVPLDDRVAGPEHTLEHCCGDLADAAALGRDRDDVVAVLADAVALLVARPVGDLADLVVEREAVAWADDYAVDALGRQLDVEHALGQRAAVDGGRLLDEVRELELGDVLGGELGPHRLPGELDVPFIAQQRGVDAVDRGGDLEPPALLAVADHAELAVLEREPRVLGRPLDLRRDLLHLRPDPLVVDAQLVAWWAGADRTDLDEL